MLTCLDQARPIHFVGIGGVSMSGLALMLHSLGHHVTGSDTANSLNVRELQAAGIRVALGHHACNLAADTQLLVATSASLAADNPELLAAQAAGIRVVDRAELLGALMAQHSRSIAIAGTRGKTTTTALVARMLEASGLDPAVSVGTGVSAVDGNFRLGSGDYFVAEACEYHRAFLNLDPHAAIVLNIAADHGDYFSGLDDITDAFQDFVHRIRPGGLLVVSADSAPARDLEVHDGTHKVTVGFAVGADYRIRTRAWANGLPVFDIHHATTVITIAAQLAGRHNIANIAAAFALGNELGLPSQQVLTALETFTGAPRRLQYTGNVDGIHVYDDLACAPGEITATMSALRGLAGGAKITAVLRPNSYTRVRDFLTDYAPVFTDAEDIVLTGIYRGRDTDTFGVDPAALVDEFRKLGRTVRYFPDNDGCPDISAITEYLDRSLHSGDVLVTIGPHDIAGLGPQWLTSRRDRGQHELAG